MKSIVTKCKGIVSVRRGMMRAREWLGAVTQTGPNILGGDYRACTTAVCENGLTAMMSFNNG